MAAHEDAGEPGAKAAAAGVEVNLGGPGRPHRPGPPTRWSNPRAPAATAEWSGRGAWISPPGFVRRRLGAVGDRLGRHIPLRAGPSAAGIDRRQPLV